MPVMACLYCVGLHGGVSVLSFRAGLLLFECLDLTLKFFFKKLPNFYFFYVQYILWLHYITVFMGIQPLSKKISAGGKFSLSFLLPNIFFSPNKSNVNDDFFSTNKN